jgi:hypothetical protein
LYSGQEGVLAVQCIPRTCLSSFWDMLADLMLAIYVVMRLSSVVCFAPAGKSKPREETLSRHCHRYGRHGCPPLCCWCWCCVQLACARSWHQY